VASAAPRATPLTMVSGAVAGDDLESIAASASDALGRPVAIALPALGEPVLSPATASTAAGIADSVPIRIGNDVVGAVSALGETRLEPDERAWLEAAAAAAAVTALMRDSLDGDHEGSRRALGLVPLSNDPAALVAELEARGVTVAVSTPGGDPAAPHEALREAELMVELALRPDVSLSGQEETYRLLIGVLLRDRRELELLRERTIAPLGAYDEDHDTELLATLQAFLAHHGSTTETAEAMSLHRHTVGYRLSRVQEVSGLSPYESDGRERLSLGLKAHQILEADKRRSQKD
jgi:PucR C-terminal helix-turn-helix domain